MNKKSATCIKKCQEKFQNNDELNHDEVRDHWHYTGKHRGAAHSIYNLQYGTPERKMFTKT